VLSPQIAPGTAHVLLGFEVAEALRWMGHLAPGGLALVNDARLVPPVVELGLFTYPEDPLGTMRKAGIHTVAFDAASIAKSLGDPRLGNSVMLGAIADHLPFSADVLLACVIQRFAAKGEKLVELNRQAFAAGRAAARANSAAPATA
jgi:indolepyruvate ferredoxin oxidoreductase beta subunit